MTLEIGGRCYICCYKASAELSFAGAAQHSVRCRVPHAFCMVGIPAKQKCDMITSNVSPGKNWLTKRQLADHLNCSLRTINNLMRRRILPYLKVGGLVRFDLEACETALKAFYNRSILDQAPPHK
jgi:excisionase family DNA binding protein